MDNAEIARILYRSFDQFRRIMKGPPNFTDLKQSEMGLLFHIKNGCSEGTEGIKVSELSSRLHVTSPSITQLVTGLEERGLVERKMDREDRRSVLVSLTEKGIAVTVKAEEHLMAMLTDLVDYLGPEKSMAMTEIMNDVFSYFKHRFNKGVD
jgi:DNA-binding MarR family transcriptional regulator